ncbi:dihydroneopterin aldolase [Fictibacillus aquaticus]|uniref:7,8-dihydroneopterin aldolase n=1 Tax=Fictibacillus aquaticus TaxID=2021314 RepID=A0A235F6Z1_9BACL|nr:dihydroneopterin aldolase [Fictibacillus aquaticus]OYD56978.1 dihydroneopterin aldolase [Fictibacillus aquaticus]
MDTIYVSGMKFYGYHGVFAEETKLGQRFEVDVAAGVDLREAGRSDDLEKSVNYGEIYSVVKEIMEGQPVKLVETLAENISASLLARFSLIEEVTVKVIKPDPPIPGHYDAVAVEIKRSRNE